MIDQSGNGNRILVAKRKTLQFGGARFLLDVVVAQSYSFFKLLSGENETLLIWRGTFLPGA
jgi:hypothetical protein